MTIYKLIEGAHIKSYPKVSMICKLVHNPMLSVLCGLRNQRPSQHLMLQDKYGFVVHWSVAMISLSMYSLLCLALSLLQCYKPEPHTKAGQIRFAKLDSKQAMAMSSSFLSKSKLEPRNQTKPPFLTLIYNSALAPLSGDLHPNPGTCTSCYPCISCGYVVGAHRPALQCDECDHWYHSNCIPVNDDTYE